MATFEPGDVVKVYETGFNAAHDAGGFVATIVRQMPDAEDYEVTFDEEVPEGTSPFATPDRLRLVAEAAAPDVAPAEPAEEETAAEEAAETPAEEAAEPAAEPEAVPVEEPSAEPAV